MSLKTWEVSNTNLTQIHRTQSTVCKFQPKRQTARIFTAYGEYFENCELVVEDAAAVRLPHREADQKQKRNNQSQRERNGSDFNSQFKELIYNY